MGASVCILAPEHAEAFEERGFQPDCRFHKHCGHKEADKLIAAGFGQKVRGNQHLNGYDSKVVLLEGDGSHRSVRAGGDGKRRITLIPRILGYVSKQSGFTCDPAEGIGFKALQAVMEVCR